MCKTRPLRVTAPTPSLLHWRVQGGLTQLMLAQRSGVDRTTIEHLEEGGEADLSTISKLGRALDVPTAALQRESPREQ